MVNKLLYTTLLILTFLKMGDATAQKLGFQAVLEKSPNEPTTFCIPSTDDNRAALKRENILIKYESSQWLFVTATPAWIQSAKTNRIISDFYFEFAPPHLLADTARVLHYVNEVHAGSGGLQTPFTGKDVIIGYVDTGLEFTHQDFRNEDGSTRVLRYWDHTVSTGPSPAP